MNCLKRAVIRPCIITTLGALILTWACSGLCASPSEEARAQFQKANELYEAGDFAGASREYEACLELGADGADVLYNLGNAYSKQRQIGRALAAYDAALRYAPRDRDTRYNIEQTSALRADAEPQIPKSWLVTVFDAILQRHTANEFATVTLLLFLVCSGLGLAAIIRRGRERRLVAAVCCVLVLLTASGAASVVRYSRDNLHRPGFVCVEDATMRSGPGKHFDVTGHLTDGARVQPRRTSGMWTEIVLPTGKRAWVRGVDVACL